MARGRKPAKSKEAKPPVARKAPKGNARVRDLEKRLAEAHEQQAATAEILRVIRQSPADPQPVFDAIARSALRLCESTISVVTRYDGKFLHLAAHNHVSPEADDLVTRLFPTRPSRKLLHGRVVLDAAVVHLPDIQADPDYHQSIAATYHARSGICVPILLDGRVLGAIAVARQEVRPFSETQIELMKTFADQAVIAIENVRLFTELQEKNQALTEAHAQATESLEQQTATSEILRVISQSPTDVQPVFDAIVSSAVRLCESTYGVVHRFDGAIIEQPIAMYNVTDGQVALYRRSFPLTGSIETALGECAVTRRTVHVEDALMEHRYRSDTEAVRMAREVLGYRTLLAAPSV